MRKLKKEMMMLLYLILLPTLLMLIPKLMVLTNLLKKGGAPKIENSVEKKERVEEMVAGIIKQDENNKTLNNRKTKTKKRIKNKKEETNNKKEEIPQNNERSAVAKKNLQNSVENVATVTKNRENNNFMLVDKGKPLKIKAFVDTDVVTTFPEVLSRDVLIYSKKEEKYLLPPASEKKYTYKSDEVGKNYIFIFSQAFASKHNISPGDEIVITNEGIKIIKGGSNG